MKDITFWGFVASPYQLKMQALADHAGVEWRRWPDQAGVLQAVKTAARLSKAKRAETILRFPGRDAELDEYPKVPYYFTNDSQFYYDSSGLAYHLDQESTSSAPLLPQQPALRFICQLIDEAFDEFGLYMVHHNRWVVSAPTNCMGKTMSHEIRKLVPPVLRHRMARTMPQRQVRRCPYLFSVAPQGFNAGVTSKLLPPSREGFPPTHEILNTAWRRYLAAVENLLEHQPFLLGERFTLADASAYGQLGMNLIDGKAAELLESLAPLTFSWLCMIRDGRHKESAGELYLSEHLERLLEIIAQTFIPLMQQNEDAYLIAIDKKQTLFNEAAFDKGEALYDGRLMGLPFRAVIKSFQVPVWRGIRNTWNQMEELDRGRVQSLYPVLRELFQN